MKRRRNFYHLYFLYLSVAEVQKSDADCELQRLNLANQHVSNVGAG